MEGLDTCLDDLVCVRCGGALVAHDATLECVRCTGAYPVLGGIPLLLHRPAAALAVCRLSITADRASAEAIEHQISAALRRRPSAELRQRVERWRRGTLANLDLVQAHAGPLAPQPGSGPDEDLGILDWVACQASGWSIHRLLPYFHLGSGVSWPRLPLESPRYANRSILVKAVHSRSCMCRQAHFSSGSHPPATVRPDQLGHVEVAATQPHR
jgi:hypothetical protein